MTPTTDNRITPGNFWERGRAMIAAMFPDGGAPIIRLGTAEYEAWAKYFVNHLHWTPWALRALRTHQIDAMTVPAQWPEWFDTDYAAK